MILHPILAQRKQSLQCRNMLCEEAFHSAASADAALCCMPCQVLDACVESGSAITDTLVIQRCFHAVKVRINGQSEDQNVTSLAQMSGFMPALQEVDATIFSMGTES